jgi:hypothetical protein
MKIERIIFLDFDGVIVTPATRFRFFEHGCMARLKQIVDETNASIVISSTWRILDTFSTLKAMFEPFGMFETVIDKTPNHNKSWARGKEIDEWLTKSKDNPRFDIKSFIILDDDSDMEPHMDRLVKTECEIGLEQEHVEQSIKMLTNP